MATPTVEFFTPPNLPVTNNQLLTLSTTDAVPPITEYQETWAARNGYADPKNPTSISQPYEQTTLKVWVCSPDDTRAIVKGYTVENLGHSWPRTTDGGVATFNATPDEIVPFFEAHPFCMYVCMY